MDNNHISAGTDSENCNTKTMTTQFIGEISVDTGDEDQIQLGKNTQKKEKHPETTASQFLNISFSKASIWCKSVRDDRALMLDVFSRVLFPLSFIVFNVFYWVYYLVV